VSVRFEKPSAQLKWSSNVI